MSFLPPLTVPDGELGDTQTIGDIVEPFAETTGDCESTSDIIDASSGAETIGESADLGSTIV